jgi:Tfp pilus assembly protein PilF
MPKSSRSFLHRGLTLYRSGDAAGAAHAYRRHIAAHPEDKAGHYHLGLALEASRQQEAALQCYARAVEIDPYYAEALNNLGIGFHAQGNLDAARLCYARALAARPEYTDAEYNYATAESNAGNYQAALMHFSRVLERDPRRVDAWANLANVFLALREPEEAQKACRIALAQDPDFTEAQWNDSIATLTLGQLPQGWSGFDRRGPLRHTALPRWNREPLDGKHLLIHAEQGLGDTIQFARYCSQVKADHITLECHPQLIPLFRDITGVGTLIPFGDAPGTTDFQIPLMSLPGLLETTCDTVPGPIPYLQPDAELVAQWKTRLLAPVHSLKVGIVWSGNPKHRNDRNRSMDASVLAPLAGMPHVSFYCLQQKPHSGAALSHPIGFADVFDELTWPDTAAIVSNLDLVISVDTAVAHLAGALGRPVWTLLPYAPDWRWMLDRSDTPWYPTMRLFRQPRLQDWPAVMEQVAAALRELALSCQSQI